MHHPVYLLTYRGGDAQYYIIIGFPMRLKKKRNYMDCRWERHPCRFLQMRPHKRKDDGLKGGAGGGIGKNALGERSAVDATAGGEDVPTETSDDRPHRRSARGLKFMDNVVCVDKLNAKLPEELGKQALPAGDSAC